MPDPSSFPQPEVGRHGVAPASQETPAKPFSADALRRGVMFVGSQRFSPGIFAASLQLVLLTLVLGVISWMLIRPAAGVAGETSPAAGVISIVQTQLDAVRQLWPLSVEALNRNLEEAALPSLWLVIFAGWLVTLAALGISRRFAVAAVWVLAFVLYALVLIVPLLFSSMVLFSDLALLVIVALPSGRLFSERLTARLMTAAIVVSMLALSLDVFVSWNRPLLIGSNLYIWLTIGLAGIFALLIALGFRRYPLRQKLIFLVAAVSVLSIGAVALISINSTQASIRGTASQSLLTSASQTAASVDSFLRNIRETLVSEAQLPVFSEYLALSEEFRTEEAAQPVDQTLRQLLTAKRSSAALGGSLLSYLQGYALLDVGGIVIYDTEPQNIGLDLSQADYFLRALADQQAYISPVFFDRTNRPVIYFSTRVYDSRRLVMGILVTRYNALVLQQIIYESNDLAGPGAYGVLIDNRFDILLANGSYSQLGFKTMVPVDETSLSFLLSQGLLPNRPGVQVSTDQLSLYENVQRMKPLFEDLAEQRAELADAQTNLSLQEFALEQTRLGTLEQELTFNYIEPVNNRQQLAAYTALDIVPWSVVYTQAESYFLKPVANQVRNIQILAMVVTLVAAGLAVLLSQVLAAPISALTAVAATIQSGDLSVRAPVDTADEVGRLAETINSMAGQLQQTLSGLEARVEDRTRDLARRSSDLQAAAEVGRTAANLRNINELLPRVSQLISERFGFYHVGVFLVDDSGRFAVLRAANSEGGRRMLERGHRLGVGQQGIVGYVTSTGQPRIALDVGADAVFFNNPDLPLTRSEMALPLFSGGRLFGALDVQSTEPSAFTPQDVTVLQVMADLIAVAIENARLFEDSQQALEATRRAYGEVSSKGWSELLRSQSDSSVRSKAVAAVTGQDQVETNPASLQPLSIPIWVRETIVGYLDTVKPVEKGPWTEDEVDTVTHIIEQVGVALESARLYQASQVQAERERLISDVTTRMRESLDVDAVLQVAAVQIRQALDLKSVTVSLASESLAAERQTSESVASVRRSEVKK